MLILILILGFIIGALTGFLGAGGGILTVPALVYLVGLPVSTAVSTSLVLGALGPIAALAPRVRDGVDWKMVLPVAGAGAVAALGGTLVGRLVPDDLLLLMFAVLMIASAVQMFRGKPKVDGIDERPKFWVVRALAVGLLVGFLTGLLGVGGGFITVPALVFLLGLPMRLAVGTSLVVAMINSIAGIAAHAGTSSPDWLVVLAFVVPAMVASFLAALLAKRVSNKVLQRSFAGLILGVAFMTLAQVLLA
ncbi:permease [Pseudoclavibacter sp. RFBJ3]|uniref:sulfite exporter TauE/SafE family protein n=1 Tax=unclassified Pseudoclavibacter TaxID=2615177 RepID=UPI000CE81928|nr:MULTISPECIES: sulfite exporter TauE/SafE family protein [unclassified Pseudoclavibacter]PPF87529.1 permease [Pseudoclavibacter sp. RFBJ5]PPF90379.1 permease [Pseudoclavibacter sp. RFBJ3]PPG01064.1 permease [Pseudoclavibacter sp. RFBH5]PPG26167.1 permease [Pseudoclavibacter sp. RFBI4]